MGVYEGQIIWISKGAGKQWVKMGGRQWASTSDRSQHFQQLSVSLSVCLAEPGSILNLLAELSSLHTRDTRHAARDTRHRRKNEWMNGWLHEWIEKSYRCMQSRCAYYQHTLARIPSKNTCWAESESTFPSACPFSLATNCCTVQWMCVWVRPKKLLQLLLETDIDKLRLLAL